MAGGRAVPIRSAFAGLQVGDVVQVTVGAVAHGGHCVARYDGRVIFVRHALPGEVVLVRVTETRRDSFCRADAVEILTPAPGRREAPCAHFRPAGCGGCDFQHAEPALQRELKEAVVAEQLERLGGVDVPVVVEELDGGEFNWRTRVRWAQDKTGNIGPRMSRSHDVVPLTLADPCLIAAPGLTELALDPAVLKMVAEAAAPSQQVPGERPGVKRGHRGGRGKSHGQPLNKRPALRGRGSEMPEVTLTAGGDGYLHATAGPANAVFGRAAPADQPLSEPSNAGQHRITETVLDRTFQVAADGFWQVHPQAAPTLVAAVLDFLPDIRGGVAWDLYGGVGLFAAFLAAAVGPHGSVVTVESDARAGALAAINLADLPQVRVLPGQVEEVIVGLERTADVIVLDPPRAGAGAVVCKAIADQDPVVIIYVACDPAALGRDTRTLTDLGYRLAELRAFDAFPQTAHVECVARFVRA